VIAGIILAAGASTRMGSPKALLNYRGETFLDRLIRVLGGVADPVVVNPVIVALGYHAEVIKAHARGRARFVVNPNPERGQLSSLQTALAAVPPEAEGFLFMPADCPSIEPETVARLVETFTHRDPAVLFIIPRYQGRRGHPVCAASALIREFLALPPTEQASTVVHRHVTETLYIDVEDAGILVDVDDREAYRRLAESAK
jgi:molybdenum cofactor cytidylyltransferase